jgi:hypothetical protein
MSLVNEIIFIVKKLIILYILMKLILELDIAITHSSEVTGCSRNLLIS